MNDTGSKKRLPTVIVTAIVLWLLFMCGIFALNDVRKPFNEPLYGRLNIREYFVDGVNVLNEDKSFTLTGIKKGDRIVVDIDIPQNIDMKCPELLIPLYNSAIKVWSGNELLYGDVIADKKSLSRHYGNRIYEIPLSSGNISEGITLEVTSASNITYSDFDSICIIEAADVWKYILGGKTLIFSVGIALLVLSSICVFYFTVRSFQKKSLMLGLPISLFELFISGWFFASLRMFYFLFGNTELCAKLEYYCLYLASLPLAVFIYNVADVPAFKKLIKILILIYSVFYLTATVIELLPVPVNYSDMLTLMHGTAGTMILVLVIAIFAGVKSENNTHTYILRYGVLAAMVFGVFEIIRFNVVKYLLNVSWITTHGLSALAILVIAVSLVIYLISVSSDEYAASIEKKQLLLLAYKDILTGIPNRAACYENINDMENRGIREYSMIFIDLNNLKLANDVYGHEKGDELIKTVAGHIDEVFSPEGFSGRWGGDEFIACVFGNKELTCKLVNEFKERMDSEDKSGRFPFAVSAACGCVYSEESSYIEPLDAVRKADAIMYENKQRMKEEKRNGDM